MKYLAFLCLVALACSKQTPPFYYLEQGEEYFQEFVNTYDKQYSDASEEAKRFEIFKSNLEVINKLNSEDRGAIFAVNQFSDLTKEEFVEKYTGYSGELEKSASSCDHGTPSSKSGPDSWDWRDKGVVSTPKNQGPCGSCWAFSTIGNIEAHYAMKHKDILDLAEQQLVDCDKNSLGCSGTQDMNYPFTYMVEAGTMQEQDYPYIAAKGACKYDKSKVKVHLTGCKSYFLQDENQLKDVLYNTGPLSIAVQADTMQHYHKGILKDCPDDPIDHAVLLVGYGTENGTPFWVIKNSWGTSFGEKGYIRIQRGVDACGLMKTPSLESIVS